MFETRVSGKKNSGLREQSPLTKGEEVVTMRHHHALVVIAVLWMAVAVNVKAETAVSVGEPEATAEAQEVGPEEVKPAAPPSTHVQVEKRIVQKGGAGGKRRQAKPGKSAIVRGHHVPAGHLPVYQELKSWNPASVSFVEARDRQVLIQTCAYIDQKYQKKDEREKEENKMEGVVILAIIAIVVMAMIVALVALSLRDRRGQEAPSASEVLGAIPKGMVVSAAAWRAAAGAVGWRVESTPAPPQEGIAIARAGGAEAATAKGVRAQRRRVEIVRSTTPPVHGVRESPGNIQIVNNVVCGDGGRAPDRQRAYEALLREARARGLRIQRDKIDALVREVLNGRSPTEVLRRAERRRWTEPKPQTTN